MSQGVLPFKYEEEKTGSGLTAFAGLPLYLDLAKIIGLSKSIQKHLKVRENSQGWTDSQLVLSIILLNLAGGDCVDDLKTLEADEGFCAILRKAEVHGLKRKVRRALDRRWRKEKKRSVPSPSAIFRYLSKFHDVEQEKIHLHTEFRDGNVPAGFEQLRLFKEALMSCATVKTLRYTGILPNANALRNNQLCPAWKNPSSLNFPFLQWKCMKIGIRFSVS